MTRVIRLFQDTFRRYLNARGRTRSSSVAGDSFEYDVFISYSHHGSRLLAMGLQTGLQRIAKPWYRLRASRVFRDETNLAANPGAWPVIERELGHSRYLVLLASPAAAQSRWVRREVDLWIQLGRASRLLIVVTSGTIRWNQESNDFDWRSTDAVPPNLAGAFINEPLWVDLTWASEPDDATLRNPRFLDTVARIAAPIRNVSLDELIGADYREHRRTRRIALSAVLTLTVLTLLSVAASILAANARNRAAAERDAALMNESRLLSQLSSAETSRGDAVTGLLLALEALPPKRHSEVNEWFGWRSSMTDRPYAPAAEAALYEALQELRESKVLDHGGDTLISVDVNSNGTLAVTAAVGGTVRVWRVPDGHLHRTLAATKQCFGAVFDRKSERILTWGDGGARLWSIDSRELVGTFAVGGAFVRHATMSANETLLLTADPDGFVHLWNLQSRALVRTIRASDAYIESAEFDPKAQHFATGDESGNVRAWRVADGKMVGEFARERAKVAQVRFSPDGTRLAAGSGRGRLRIWNWRSGRVEVDIAAHASEITAISYAPDGRTIVTASVDGTGAVWDSTSGARRAILRPGTLSPDSTAPLWLRPRMQHASYSADSSTIITASSDGLARIWSAVDGTNVATLAGHSNGVNAAAFDPFGRWAISASSDGTARVWSTQPGLQSVTLTHGTPVPVARLSPDGRFLLTGATLGGEVWLSRASDGVRVATLDGPEDVLEAAFSKSGRLIATAHPGLVQIWDGTTGTPRGELPHPGYPQAVAFSEDDTFLLTGSAGGARLWDVARLTLIRTYESPRDTQRVAFAQDGRLVVTGGIDGVRVYKRDTGELFATVTEPTDVDRPITIDRRGEWIAVGDESGTIRLWSLVSGKVVTTIATGAGGTGSLALSADGSLVAAASEDRLARVWTKQGTLKSTLQSHGVNVGGLEFSPDGSRLLGSSSDNTLRLWDVDTGTMLAILRGHRDGVISAQFSTDGDPIVSGSNDGTARLWTVLPDTNAAIDYARRIVPRELTDDQRCRLLMQQDKCRAPPRPADADR